MEILNDIFNKFTLNIFIL